MFFCLLFFVFCSYVCLFVFFFLGGGGGILLQRETLGFKVVNFPTNCELSVKVIRDFFGSLSLVCDWSKNSRHALNHSDAKRKLNVTFLPVFSRAFGGLPVFYFDSSLAYDGANLCYGRYL